MISFKSSLRRDIRLNKKNNKKIIELKNNNNAININSERHINRKEAKLVGHIIEKKSKDLIKNQFLLKTPKSD